MVIKSGILTLDCCSCNNCVELCPSSAIRLIEAELGSKVASVDVNKCVGCNKCDRVCPVINSSILKSPCISYAGFSLSPKAVKSASGGMFFEIASSLLQKGYFVYGAAYNEDLSVSHIEVTTYEDLHLLQGSKYVKSSTSGINKKILERLSQGEKVLFSGTPCQVASLYRYLPARIPLDNLITVDIICHGTPSNELFLQYCRNYEIRKKRKIKSIVFRDKKFGHKLIGTMYYFPKLFHANKSTLFSDESSYYKLFLKGLTYYRGCYNCTYANPNRCSDITIGDFWGAKQEVPEFYDTNILSENASVSALIVNTDKGLHVVEEIRKNIVLQEVKYEKIVRNNPQLNSPVFVNNKTRSIIVSAFERDGYDGIEEYYKGTTDIAKYVMRLSSYLPNGLKRLIKKMKNFSIF